MSLTEIKSEIAHLSNQELVALRNTIDAELTKKQTKSPVDVSQYLGSLRGTAVLKPGWDEDEPLEDWEALRDDTST